MHAPLFRTTRASHLLQRPTAKSPLITHPAVETMYPPCQHCQGPCQVRCTNTTFHRVVVFCSVYATCMCISAQKGLCNQKGRHIYAVHTMNQRCHQSPCILRRACLRASLLFMFCSFVIACLTLEAFVCWDPEHSNALSHVSFLKFFKKTTSIFQNLGAVMAGLAPDEAPSSLGAALVQVKAATPPSAAAPVATPPVATPPVATPPVATPSAAQAPLPLSSLGAALADAAKSAVLPAPGTAALPPTNSPKVTQQSVSAGK
jgi:hypothetical protein